MKRVAPARRVRGKVIPPPDKSLSHRALIFASIAETPSRIGNLLDGQDVRSTLRVLELLGVEFEGDFERLKVIPPKAFEEPMEVLDCGNSGTTARLMTGVLSSRSGFRVLVGDASLSKRPMKRVVEPLRKMGATILGRENGEYLPLAISGGDLHGYDHELPVASAQVKSALLLAGLRADGTTSVIEPYKSRDHTERLLKLMGARIRVDGLKVEIEPSQLEGVEFRVPGDFSSAAFFLALGAIHPNAFITVENVNLNPTRTGFLEILKRMGAEVSVEIGETEPEPIGKVVVSSSSLEGIVVDGEVVVSAIDELPLVALLGIFARGKTVVKDAGELRKKESDRIHALVSNLKSLGVKVEELDDGFVIEGPQKLKGGRVKTFGDHRIAMTFAVAGAVSEEGIALDDPDCVAVSFPNFFDLLERVIA